MKELIEVIARALVDDPSLVEVTMREEEEKIVYELHVGEGDMGKVIGKQGRIAKALRTIVKSATAKSEKKVFVDII